MDIERITAKLSLQENPTILLTDVDGTLFSPNLTILTAPIYNTQTAAFLAKKHIPFVLVTGRSFWRKIDQYHITLLGLPKPDAVITANGTILYIRKKNSYSADFNWQGVMQSTKVTDFNKKTTSWNKWEITNRIIDYFHNNNLPFHLGKGNTYLIRLRLNKYHVKKVDEIRRDLLSLFPRGVRILLTEKLLWENTENIFSGEMLVTPSTAGKDKAVAYFLKQISQTVQKPIHAILFGDASIDIPMLTMKEDPTFYTLSQYAVHPTPLVRKMLEKNKEQLLNLSLLVGDGPKEILWTLRPELRISLQFKARTVPKVTANNEPKNREPEQKFSSAQNNKGRKVIQIFEGVLNNLVDKNLSPNEVSFLGLHKLARGLELLHKDQGNFVDKTKGFYHYSFGNLTDVLDGIRARRSNKREENGQLVDGFSDRVKEFMQLFHRAKKRIISDESFVVPTLLSAISCCLPSIARAQVEICNKTVNERDEKGGSMIDRTKRLFLSLLLETIGMDDQSFAKDREIFETNIATFQNRISQAKKVDDKKIVIKKLSDFQKKALERWLLYIDVLQQEDKIIKKFLAVHPKILKAYENDIAKLTKNYVELPINKLRKKWSIIDYELKISDYIK